MAIWQRVANMPTASRNGIVHSSPVSVCILCVDQWNLLASRAQQVQVCRHFNPFLTCKFKQQIVRSELVGFPLCHTCDSGIPTQHILGLGVNDVQQSRLIQISDNHGISESHHLMQSFPQRLFLAPRAQ